MANERKKQVEQQIRQVYAGITKEQEINGLMQTEAPNLFRFPTATLGEHEIKIYIKNIPKTQEEMEADSERKEINFKEIIEKIVKSQLGSLIIKTDQ